MIYVYILEEALPLEWNILWTIIVIPIIIFSIRNYKDFKTENENVISAMIISFIGMVFLTIVSVKYGNPVINGNGIPTVILGFNASVFITIPVLIFIKIFSGVGGFLSIGTNLFAIAVCGPFVGYHFFKVMEKRFPQLHPINIALSIIITEVVSAVASCLQLALAYHYPTFIECFIYNINLYLINYSLDFILLSVIEIAVSIVFFKFIPQIKNNEEVEDNNKKEAKD